MNHFLKVLLTTSHSKSDETKEKKKSIKILLPSFQCKRVKKIHLFTSPLTMMKLISESE